MLRLALASVAAQTRQPFRVVVVDDHSSPSLEPIVKEFGYEYLCSSLLSGTSRRPAKLRTLGWQHLRGSVDYVACLDSDDCVTPDWLESMLHAIGSVPRIGAAYPRVALFGSAQGIHENGVVSAGGLVRAECLEKIGGYPDVGHGWDETQLQHALRRFGYEGAFVNSVYWYRKHPKSVVGEMPTVSFVDMYSMRDVLSVGVVIHNLEELQACENVIDELGRIAAELIIVTPDELLASRCDNGVCRKTVVLRVPFQANSEWNALFTAMHRQVLLAIDGSWLAANASNAMPWARQMLYRYHTDVSAMVAPNVETWQYTYASPDAVAPQNDDKLVIGGYRMGMSLMSHDLIKHEKITVNCKEDWEREFFWKALENGLLVQRMEAPECHDAEGKKTVVIHGRDLIHKRVTLPSPEPAA